jgi:hypothetical protein
MIRKPRLENGMGVEREREETCEGEKTERTGNMKKKRYRLG